MNPNTIATELFNNEWEQKAKELLALKHASKLKPNEEIILEARVGDGVAYLRALLGSDQKAQVFEFAVQNVAKDKFEHTFSLMLDFFDGVLSQFLAQGRDGGLALDFVKCDFEKIEIFARQEYRDFEVERMTEEFLNAHNDKKNLKKE